MRVWLRPRKANTQQNCVHMHHQRASVDILLAARIASGRDEGGEVTDCIEWAGYRNQSGYGIRWIDNKRYRVHRLAWEAANGSIKDDLCVLHKCDNRACINVDHLFLGTRGDNAKDRDAKHRWKPRKGVANGKHVKLSDSIVRTIRSSSENNAVLARRYGTVGEVIRRVKAGLTWRHVK